MATHTHERLLEAVFKALEERESPNDLGLMELKAPTSFGLMQLERHGGPACGAAGGIVRRWPKEGIEVYRNLRHFRLKFDREGRKSVVRVEELPGTCPHPVHTNPGLLVPCPECGWDPESVMFV